jgi:predicted nuclease of predicted toxin-antitoxin system
MELAATEGRVLGIRDKDFGELAIVFGMPHCGIVRLVRKPARQQGHCCRTILDLCAKIRATVAGIVNILADVNALTPEQHRGANF